MANPTVNPGDAVAAAGGNAPRDELLYLIHHVSSTATAQFVRGLLLGIVLTVAAALIAARALLFHSPRSASRDFLLRRRRQVGQGTPRKRSRTTSTFSNCGSTTGGNPALPMPLSSLILLHRQLLLNTDGHLDQPTNLAAGATGSGPHTSPNHFNGETMAFANFLMCEIIQGYRSDPRFLEWLRVDILQAVLNRSLPSFVEPITVSELSLGQHDQFPLLRRAHLKPCRATEDRYPVGSAQAESRGYRQTKNAHAQSALNERWVRLHAQNLILRLTTALHTQRIELEVEFENLSDVAKRASMAQATSQTATQQARAPTHLSPADAVDSRAGSSRNARKDEHGDETRLAPSSDSPPETSPSPDPEQECEPNSPASFLELALDTQLVLDWPRRAMAALPIHLQLEMTRLRATIAIEFHPAGDDLAAPVLSIALVSGFTLDFRISSLLGSRTKLRDVPKIADLITMSLRQQIHNYLVEPACITIPLPAVPSPNQHLGTPSRAGHGAASDTANACQPATSELVSNANCVGIETELSPGRRGTDLHDPAYDNVPDMPTELVQEEGPPFHGHNARYSSPIGSLVQEERQSSPSQRITRLGVSTPDLRSSPAHITPPGNSNFPGSVREIATGRSSAVTSGWTPSRADTLPDHEVLHGSPFSRLTRGGVPGAISGNGAAPATALLASLSALGAPKSSTSAEPSPEPSSKSAVDWAAAAGSGSPGSSNTNGLARSASLPPPQFRGTTDALLDETASVRRRRPQ